MNISSAVAVVALSRLSALAKPFKDCLLKVSLRAATTPRVMRASASRMGARSGSVEVGAGLDDFIGQGFGETVFGEVPVAVHRAKAELRRVHHDVATELEACSA
jgi:hypothetical protein